MQSGFMEEFKREIADMSVPKKYSLEERLRKLGMGGAACDRIRRLPYRNSSESESEFPRSDFKWIELEYLLGVNGEVRGSDWVECLALLHKQRNFDLFVDKQRFKAYLDGLGDGDDDLPHVICCDGNYYVGGNGKHRLTIAKCLELDVAPAVVWSK